MTRLIDRTARNLPDPAVDVLIRLRPYARPAKVRVLRRWVAFLSDSERWSEDRLAAYQQERLRELISHAYEHVPYYRRVLDELGASPEDFREPADLRRLPLLEKTDLQTHQSGLLADDASPGAFYYYTSAGSTGIPVGFYHDNEQSLREQAFMETQWARVGFRRRHRRVVLRGTVVSDGRLYERSLLANELVVSSYHLTEDRIPAYLKRIREFRPQFIQAYPSSISLLARLMLDLGEPPVKGVRAVLCGSENVYEWQRDLVQRAFGCRIFSWYGQSEAVCLAAECEHDSRLHIFPQYGYVELLAQDGTPVTEPGVAGEIVATGLHARAMPLIRYRTADIAMFAHGHCEGCSRAYLRLERIEGRLQEFIVTGGGRRISLAAVNLHTAAFDHVRQFRFYQDTPGQVRLRLVPGPSFSESEDIAKITGELAPKLGADCEVVIELVPEIPMGARGKHHFIDQRLGLELGDRV